MVLFEKVSRMKEMCPTHRIDVLSHALVCYGYTSKKRLRKYFIIVHYD